MQFLNDNKNKKEQENNSPDKKLKVFENVSSHPKIAFFQQAINKNFEEAKLGKNVKWGSLFQENNFFEYQIKKIPLEKETNSFKYKAYIFEIFNVLLKFDEEKFQVLFKNIENHSLNLLKNAIKKNANEEINKILIEINEDINDFSDKISQCLIPIESNLDFLKELKEKKMKLICLSYLPFDFTFKIRRSFDFFDEFDFILTSKDFEFDSFNQYPNVCDINPEEIFTFDSKKDLEEVKNSLNFKNETPTKDMKLNEFSINKRMNLAYEFITKYADLDKNQLFLSRVGKGVELENAKESPSELFSTVMMMNLSKKFLISKRGNNILTYISKLHNDTGHFRFFIDLDVIPCDYDTTSLSLFVLKKNNLVSDDIINETIDKMFENVNEENILMTFADPKRPRVCPIVCSNILNLVYLMKRENNPCISATRKFIFDFLSTGKFEDGCTYYPNPDLFLFTISKLVYYYPKEFNEFKEEIIIQLKKRIGEKDLENSLSLSCRLICSELFNIENEIDYQKLISLQKEDGSWPESLLYTTHNKAKGLFYWTNIGLTTIFALKALELKSSVKNQNLIFI